jgi:hypothetical protein
MTPSMRRCANAVRARKQALVSRHGRRMPFGRRLASCALIITAALSALTVLSSAVEAQSIGISPGSLEVTSALRGARYSRTFTIINQQASPLVFDLSVTGEAADWVKLYDRADTSAPVDRIEVPPNTNGIVSVIVEVPPDAPNRRFIAEIGLQSATDDPEGDDSGAAVAPGLALDVVIDVTGTQVLQGNIYDVQVRDTEIGLPLRARMDFENTGNVQAEPEIHMLVSNEAGEIVGDATTVADAIEVGARETIKGEWDTSGQPEGPYHLELSVLLDGEEVYAAPFDVRIWPRGTFTRQGELTSLRLDNRPYPGAVALLVAGFRNIGEIDTLAAFDGEVYRDGTLVGKATSTELLVEEGGAVELEVFVEVPERGKYRVEGVVNFEGKETAPMSVDFKVPPDLGSGFLFGRPLWQVAIGSFLVMTVAAAAGLEGRRWWQRAHHESRGAG